jgi:hypothetical protein
MNYGALYERLGTVIYDPAKPAGDATAPAEGAPAPAADAAPPAADQGNQ